ncbi:MAG: protein-L-isoaspartate(D-aspartate) O-methyltransferase [Cyanobacteriota bacterium]
MISPSSSFCEGNSGIPEAKAFDPFALEREQMVKEQIVQRGIRAQQVLQAMRKVPRHCFVSLEQRPRAYTDRPLSIGYGQTISQPYIVALMTEAAQLKPESVVLEIGTGSGYQTAVLAELAQQVYSLERIPALAEQARQTLYTLGYRNIHIRQGDGYQGWPEHAPYDAIVVTAAPSTLPTLLPDQLAMGGRLVVPVGEGSQSLLILHKTPEGLLQKGSFPVQFVPMV